ncbi:uncharacterized protein BDZ99DRAFT_458596 [Mytilinidion resinicola]|uniref:Uncharacterized protein n=1 Tax=Mytilinidion resinicola TaxID=574789 RepID=A0A6A6Z1H6_9PEZI|nr:uncharacterized protein BDZ99DRAFT_458596 [Mytilinidion resinicola]KAF2814579.1 hypothetical protein BDZ99DRAFT_458596 [Mytilinidion resinicola]
MSIGYVLETAISVILVAVFIFLSFRKTDRRSRWIRLILANSTRAFYENAIFFASGIQIASIVVLAKANFGISANGMGAITMKITWSISLLTLLPLLPLSFGNFIFRESNNEQEDSIENIRTSSSESGTKARENSGHVVLANKNEEDAQDRRRFFLYVLCWMLSVFPFLSRMVGTFGHSQIGSGSGTVVSTTDWALIEHECFKGVDSLQPSQETAMSAFGIGSWLFLSLTVIWKIFLSGIQRQHPNSRLARRLRHETLFLDTYRPSESWLWMCLCIVTPLLSVFQMWTFFRLQRLQTQMTKASGGEDPDTDWTFGQIVAVIMFTPVLVEVGFVMRNRKIFDKVIRGEDT